MNVNVDIIPYSEEGCIYLEYVPGAKIECENHNGDFYICANREGLQFLAKVCLTLAQEDMPVYSHVHFDGFPFFESDNFEMTIERSRER